jgi:hypothetical protein
MSDLPKPDYARNMRFVGYCDQRGRTDGVQIMVHRGYAYIGHMFSKGFNWLNWCFASRAKSRSVSMQAAARQ